MKLLAFFVVYASLIISISGYKIPWRVGLAISIVYVVLLRQGGFQGDFQVYLEELRAGWLSFYYIREPLFWVGSKILYFLIGSERFVIFIYDFIFCFFLLRAIKKVAGIEVFLIVLVSFPVFLGIENIYRQVLGLPFALFFLYHCLRGDFFSTLFYIVLASLFHNSYIILIPLIIFCVPRISSGVSILLVASFGSIGFGILGYLGLSVDAVEKSSAQATGLSLEYLYAAVIFLISISLIAISKRLFGRWVAMAAIINAIYMISVAFLGSSQSERVGMILIISVFYTYLCFWGGRRTGAISFLKAEMFFILALPVFLFPSTRGFLLAGGY